MEYAEAGDIHSLMSKYKKEKKTFSEKEIWKFAYEIALGIAYLHS